MKSRYKVESMFIETVVKKLSLFSSFFLLGLSVQVNAGYGGNGLSFENFFPLDATGTYRSAIGGASYSVNATYEDGNCGERVYLRASGSCSGSGDSGSSGSCHIINPASRTITVTVNEGVLERCKLEIFAENNNGVSNQPNARTPQYVKLQHEIVWLNGSKITTPTVALNPEFTGFILEAQTELLDSTRAIAANVDNGVLKFTNISTDFSVCSVTEWGRVIGNKPGTCTVTVSVSEEDTINFIPLSETISWDFEWQNSDGDSHYDDVDNCWLVTNEDQADTDSSGIGDACNDVQDPDGDDYEYENDNCISVFNPSQDDTDNSSLGDACNDHLDPDGDEYENEYDNCPTISNPDQTDSGFDDADGKDIGTACNVDSDNDGIKDPFDNCPLNSNPFQEDLGSEGPAGDGIGDACDADQDLDLIDDALDNCPTISNKLQADGDNDGIGDVCEPDSDGDGVADDTGTEVDNCTYVSNPNQEDIDGNGIGDACEMVFVTPTGAGDQSCETWGAACDSLTDALTALQTLNRSQIFIAQGVYRLPSTIDLPSGVTIQGGFVGTEKTASQADSQSNPTVISGDINADDLIDLSNGVVRSVNGGSNVDNLSNIFNIEDTGSALSDRVTLRGLVLNASKGSAVTVENGRLLMTDMQLIANAQSALIVRASGVSDDTEVLIGDTLFEANQATNGAAIYVEDADSVLTLSNVEFFNNAAASAAGAIFATDNATISITQSEFTLNDAANSGAMYFSNVSADIDKTSFTGNKAITGPAGALRVVGNTDLNLDQVEFNTNQANTHGGALFLDVAAANSVDVEGGLFIGNEAENNGGAVYSATSTTTVNIINTSFYANQANNGGAVFVTDATANVDHATIVSNVALNNGAGIRDNGNVNVSRSIVAGNLVSGVENNINGAFTDGGFNIVGYNDVSGLVGGASLSQASSFTAKAVPVADDSSQVAVNLVDLVAVSPNFGGGDGYFGYQKSMPIPSDSIARDKIPAANCSSTQDQRGEARPDIVANSCDIGAYEFTTLTCIEDAQRRFAQGEKFIKSCEKGLEDLELGSVHYLFLLMLSYVGLRRRKWA